MPAEITTRSKVDISRVATRSGPSGGGRQGSDRQADKGFTYPHVGTGKSFNQLCIKMLSATAYIVILSELDNDEGIYFVKCYTSEYLIGRKTKDFVKKLKNVPTSLNEALNEDLFVLLGEHFTLWEWLRMRDFANLNYGFSAGLIP